MQLNEYQLNSRPYARYPDTGKNIIYPALGLAGESGEYVDNIKKAIRDKEITNGILSVFRRGKTIDELGDVLWYVANCATELGITLDAVAERNLLKLADRKVNGKKLGSG